ncbi:hypothetical protein [Isoptericola sp. NPDC019482]|uniref:zf-HC2 domain-containing protein n=1 Tax=Isoptericola sp. NPDC019482 TaxID=3154688 RepID=UPI0034946180
MAETGGDDAPARAGYVDDAIRRIRVAAAAAGRGGAPGAAGTADPEVLRTAVASLSPDDQRLLWATYVQRQEPAAVAAALGTHPRTAARLMPQAEQALATALADAHARGCPPGCTDTRAALFDLVHRRLPAGQEAELEDHLLDCAGCLRAFVDVREPGWALRDAGPRLLAGGWSPAAVAATTMNGATDATGGAKAESRPVRRQSWLIVAGTVACVAVAAVAIALGTGDAAPAAPDPGSSPETTTVGTAPGDATSPLATLSSAPRGDGAPSAGPTPSDEASATPSGEPTPTPSTGDDEGAADPSTSPTSSPGRDDEPTTSPTSSGSTSSKPTSRPSSTPTTTPTDEGSPTGTATPTEEPTDGPTTETPTEPTDPEPTDPAPTDPEPTDPDPVEPDPGEPTE